VSSRAEASEEAPARSGFSWYIYGVVAAGEAPAKLEIAASVDPPREVELLREGPLAALTSRVSASEFDEEKLLGRLNDPDWLEEKIRAHEQVLEQALGSTSVIPFRFCTVYRDEADLRRFLAERSGELEDVLRNVQGRVELGVKAFVDRDSFARGLGAENEAPVSGSAAGRAYLERRRTEEHVKRELSRFAAEVVRAGHERLLSAADEGLLLPLQERELSGRSEEMLMNGAYLVPVAGADFERAVEELQREFAGRAASFEITGPWPPYNFVPREVGA